MRHLALLTAALLIFLHGSAARACPTEFVLTFDGTLATCTGVCGLFALPGDAASVVFDANAASAPGFLTLGTDIGVPDVAQGSDPDSDVQNTACSRDFATGSLFIGGAEVFLHVNGAPETPGGTNLEVDAAGNVLSGFASLQTLDGLPELLGQPKFFIDLDADAGTFAVDFDDPVSGSIVQIATGTGAFVPEPGLLAGLAPGALALGTLARRKRARRRSGRAAIA